MPRDLEGPRGEKAFVVPAQRFVPFK